MMNGLLALIFYVGCCTDATHTNGLQAVDLDVASGAMRVAAVYPAADPIYLAHHGDVLYAAWGDGLRSFRRDGAKLTPLDALPLGTRCLCHVATLRDGRAVTWADYADGQAGIVPVRDGRFGKPTVYRHTGVGPNLPRQDCAHCHQALPTPDERHFAVVDLGLDTLTLYPTAPDAKPQTANVKLQTLPRGAGPRHLVFHPNGRLVFVAFELGNLVGSYEWDDARGFGRLLDQQPTLELWPSGRPYDGDLVAAIRMSPDGRRVIVSNRGEQSLVAFDVDTATGRLALKARSKLPGSWPRDFLFVSPTRALVTMERSGDVHALAYDPESARFTVLNTIHGLYHPVALDGN